MIRVLFVGDKPSPKMKPGARPFQGAACEKRFNEWIKFLDVDYYDVINSHKISYSDNLKLHCTDIFDEKIVCLGELAYIRVTTLGYEAFKLPHPSGLNRKNNDKEYIKEQLTKCKEYINE